MWRPPLSVLLVLLSGVASAIQVLSCAPEPERAGGIFGDRPVEPSPPSEEDEDAASSDGAADADADAGAKDATPADDSGLDAAGDA